jgi:hypothetical protein
LENALEQLGVLFDKIMRADENIGRELFSHLSVK